MDHQAPPLAKQLLKSNAAGEDRISSLQGCRSWKTIHALVDNPSTSEHMQAALSWFNGERKGLHKEDGKGGVEEALEEIEWGYVWSNRLHACMKFSNSNKRFIFGFHFGPWLISM